MPPWPCYGLATFHVEGQLRHRADTSVQAFSRTSAGDTTLFHRLQFVVAIVAAFAVMT